ncbi:MAG: flagellar motor protein MotB [Verrucomicrobia bacterium]|nr:flagellar motor protein MotB [Verrucomicrobiota bacterium]MBI3871076.1 flagellar motor protein MotB [Verrucomicrobiota bacterium]
MAGGGGSWKVAYADFVTAMMALFLVLWLVSQDQKIKESVERAFRNPFASLTKESVGIIPSKETQAVRSEHGNFDSASAVELNVLRRLSQDLNKQLQDQNPEDDPIKMELTSEGLKISIFDRARKPIFEGNSEKLTEYGNFILSTLAWDIARYTSFNIELEGHTESRADKDSGGGPDKWKISSDRANASLQALTKHGVKPGQFKKVAGYADTEPMAGVAPTDENNRRVTVMLKVRGA